MHNLAEIAIFVQVVESRSFSAAADRLGMSRAAVSKSVSRLEQRLGARLLHRSTRRLSLTEGGAALFSRSRDAIAALEEAELAVDRLQSVPRGTLRISGPVYFGVHHLTPVLARFLEQYPDINADVQLDDRVVNIVEEGFDLAVRVTELKDSSLVSRRLAPCRLAVCASPAYWERHGTPAHPEDLAEHNCFVYSNLSSPHMWRFLDADDRETTVHVRGNLRFNNTEVARAAALRGMGVVRLPTFYVGEEIRESRLTPVLQNYRGAHDVSVYAVYAARDHLPPKVRVFIDCLVEAFGPEPYWDRF